MEGFTAGILFYFICIRPGHGWPVRKETPKVTTRWGCEKDQPLIGMQMLFGGSQLSVTSGRTLVNCAPPAPGNTIVNHVP